MPGVLKTLVKLLSDFKNSNNATPVDFVESALEERCIAQDEGQHFLHLAKHEPFLEKIADNFLNRYKLRRVSKINIEVLLYFIIFALNQTNDRIILNVDMFYINRLLIYLIDEDNHLLFTKIACKLFENNYVLEQIMYPLLNKSEQIQEILERNEDEESKRIFRRNVTIPKEFNCFKRVYKRPPAPPVNTPERSRRPKNKLPKFNEFADPTLPRKLEEQFEKNRERARHLLEQAQKVPYRLVELKRRKSPSPLKTKLFKANKIPPKKQVEIKGNLTSTLREGSRLIKEQENEIKKIDEIIKGGSNAAAMEQMEMEMRRKEQQKEIEDIERKRLQCLITYEEAILAKRRLLSQNKEKMRKSKEAKRELQKKIEQWRKEEREKIKAFVEKSHKIKEDAKESEKKLQEERHEQVRMQQYETKQLLRKAYEEQKQELARKVKLIEEIRTLHQIRTNMNVKQFDPTDCPNFGLLCQMSIAELQERVALVKIEMKEQLEEKRKRVLRRKEQQQEMLDNVKNFITQTRLMPKMEPLPIRIVNLEESSDLNELRRQLEEKRNLRMKQRKKKKKEKYN